MNADAEMQLLLVCMAASALLVLWLWPLAMLCAEYGHRALFAWVGATVTGLALFPVLMLCYAVMVVATAIGLIRFPLRAHITLSVCADSLCALTRQWVDAGVAAFYTVLRAPR
jgi:hypothetical protein